MKLVIHPPKSDWEVLLRRPSFQQDQLEESVRKILEAVKEGGDAAIKKYTAKFDQVELETLSVTEKEKKEAEASLREDLKEAIQQAKKNIETFHQSQVNQRKIVETMPGVFCWQKSVAIEKVGLYIPGGTAPLFSTVLMLAIPAQIAGCKEIVLCSPPQKNGQIHPATLYTANLCGITKIFKMGGVQAIGAMGYGSESVQKVYKIFGPGNQYVTMAKQLIQKEGVAIDMPAGPSEVLVYADESAYPEFVAADLLSQAEHGTDSQVVLVAHTEAFVEATQQAIQQQLKSLPRASIAQEALNNSVAIVASGQEEALELINDYGPEHLILATQKPDIIGEQIINAGSVFLGHFSPESVGDYASGTNHTLPTNGWAKSYSGVSLDSFVKKITFQQLTSEGIQHLGPAVEKMAEAEELAAHKLAVTVRLEALKNKS